MTTATAPEQGTARANLRRRLLPIVMLLVAIGGAVTWVVADRGDQASAAQLSEVKASCGEWMTSSQRDAQGDDQWCTDMFAWMGDQSGGSMMTRAGGSMMWQGAEQMGTACRQWVAQAHAELGTSGPQRCDDMVEWMTGHMSSRDGSWMHSS